MNRYESWGRFPKARHAAVVPIFWRSEPPRLDAYAQPVLPFAYGRSYGDVCLNDSGILIDTTCLSRFIAFDEKSGILRCEAGVTLAEILELIVPRGWFLPVTPGTKYVSVGGAIANDVHGKNHHKAGTFGCHVKQFELLRSNGERFLCSPIQNVELFQATIGGLGLTGLVLWAEIQLQPISTPFIDMERERFTTLEEFFEISERSDREYDYTVAWIDCLARGKNLGRGIFIRGNHLSKADARGGQSARRAPRGREQGADAILLSNQRGFTSRRVPIVRVPWDFPTLLLNRLTIKTFNTVYYRLSRNVKKIIHYDPFFYPLDAIHEWNRMYGRRGFLQYQCVVPYNDGQQAIKEILTRVAHTGGASFLAVLKKFGAISSPGMLSFVRPGVTLALDFPFQGDVTLQLLDALDAIVRDYGGAVYPAKDARMSAKSFQAYFPQWRDFARYVDPKFSSSFWRRVTA